MYDGNLNEHGIYSEERFEILLKHYKILVNNEDNIIIVEMISKKVN